MRAKTYKTGQDFGRRVGFDRVMNIRMAQARFEYVILRFDPLQIQNKGRAIKACAADIAQQTGIGINGLRNSFANRRLGKCSVHSHLQ